MTKAYHNDNQSNDSQFQTIVTSAPGRQTNLHGQDLDQAIEDHFAHHESVEYFMLRGL